MLISRPGTASAGGTRIAAARIASWRTAADSGLVAVPSMKPSANHFSQVWSSVAVPFHCSRSCAWALRSPSPRNAASTSASVAPAYRGEMSGCWKVTVPSWARASPQLSSGCSAGTTQPARCAVSSAYSVRYTECGTCESASPKFRSAGAP